MTTRRLATEAELTEARSWFSGRVPWRMYREYARGLADDLDIECRMQTLENLGIPVPRGYATWQQVARSQELKQAARIIVSGYVEEN